MLNMYIVIISVVVILLSWYLFYRYYSQRYLDFRQSFFDSNSNITLYVVNDEIIVMNRVGLEFFGFSSLESFKASYSDISDFFTTEIITIYIFNIC